MSEYGRLSRSRQKCSYFVVFYLEKPPQCAARSIAEAYSEVFQKLAGQKEDRIEEGHLLSDRVYMTISIPTECAMSQVAMFIKCRGTIYLARTY